MQNLKKAMRSVEHATRLRNALNCLKSTFYYEEGYTAKMEADVDNYDATAHTALIEACKDFLDVKISCK